MIERSRRFAKAPPSEECKGMTVAETK